MTQAALSSLLALGDQLRARLLELPEYRALLAIDRTIAEVAQLLGETASGTEVEAAEPAAEERQPEPAPVETRARVVPLPAADERGANHSRMAAAIAEAIASRAASMSQLAHRSPGDYAPYSAAS